KVLMDYGKEVFRISKVTVGTIYIYVVARQITIADSLTLWLEDVRPTNLNGQGAVTWMLDKAEGKKEIEIISDIETTATAYYQRMSLYKALHDNDNSFLKRWGGEVQRRGYTIYINKRIGIDRGVAIREGKNLTGFNCTSNIDNLVTRARGEGYNGILGNYIDSPLIDKYNRIYTSVIKYDDVKVKDENNTEGFDTEEEAIAELDRRISEEYSKNSIDKIKASYNINFVQLEKTEQYKNYIIAERVYIGDTTRVYIPRLKVNIKVRSMIKKYDVLAQKTKEIKLSNYIEAKSISIKQIVDRLNTIDSTDTILQRAKDSASSLIKSGLKNSHVIVRENEILIMDTKDINTATKVWRWNNQGLGFSSTGYNGTYGTAITSDGKIVADFITTGILNADLIKAGFIRSVNGKTWINMEDGTFNFGDKVKYDGTNVTYDFSGTNVAMKNDINTAKDELRQDYQNAKVVINNQGIQVNDGGFVLKNPNGTVVIDGTSKIHKIIKEDTVVLQFRGSSTTLTVPHNLGYKPAFSSYQQQGNDYTQIPAFTWSDNSGISAIIRARADQNNLYFDFLKKTDGIVGNKDVQIKYYIYSDVAF
ncbi:MAG: phage tail spike protein, partial [Clostridium sp.]